jgi:putative membrane protein
LFTGGRRLQWSLALLRQNGLATFAMDEPGLPNRSPPVPHAPPTSDELRTQLAGQRTLLAWIRTAVALMGFGFLVARFGLFLRQLSAMEDWSHIRVSGFSIWMGTALVLVGVAVNLFAASRHADFMRQFSTTQRPRVGASLFEIGLSVVLAVLGVIMAGYLVFVGV